MAEEQDTSLRETIAAAIQAARAGNEFWPARAIAIQRYAQLEQELGNLFAGLSDTDPIVAGIIFFKITSSRARNSILEKLFQHKYELSYNLFRNSLFKQLTPIDNQRNEIVHWNTINRLSTSDGKLEGTLLLEPPSLWPEEPSERALAIADLKQFQEKCLFYSQMVGMFTDLVVYRRETWGWPQERFDAWHSIFLQPIAYPPPADHPSVRWK